MPPSRGERERKRTPGRSRLESNAKMKDALIYIDT